MGQNIGEQTMLLSKAMPITIDARVMSHESFRPSSTKAAVASALCKLSKGQGVLVKSLIDRNGRHLTAKELASTVSGLNFIAKFSVISTDEEGCLATVWCKESGAFNGEKYRHPLEPEGSGSFDDVPTIASIDARGKKSVKQAVGDLIEPMNVFDKIVVEKVINRNGREVDINYLRAIVSQFNGPVFYRVLAPHSSGHIAVITCEPRRFKKSR